MLKKYHIKTWGCQMNVYDSQRIAEILQSLGYEETKELGMADIIILNTCHIREKATEKVYSDLGRLRILKERRKTIGKNLIIGVSGCVAQAEGEEILKRAPVVDLVFGPQTWHRLASMIKKIEENHIAVCDTDFPVEEKFDNLPEFFDANRIQYGSAFVAIQEGCDKFCTYCVVPYTRGAEYSRPVHQVLEEVHQLVHAGAKEITLLGQNVNAYHGYFNETTEWSLGQLIRKISTINGVEAIRYTTSYPAEVDEDLIAAHQDVAKLAPFLHLPLQSGSNKILKLMNRKHTVEEYLKLITRLKEANPNLAISSDFIVGFPEETEEDFLATLQVIKTVGFIQSYAFMYSPRLGTPAALYEKQIPQALKEERLHRLQEVLATSQYNFNKSTVGKEFSLLLNRTGRKEQQLVGKSPYMQAVRIEDANPNLLGQTVRVKVCNAYANSLVAEIIQG
ncbi:tRNA-2-methylthio-N(6)-dimethylallyladenosine synthase [Candidatus Hepatincola sp. Pdp]